MADIKTELRELSVAVAIGKILSNKDLDYNINVDRFLLESQKYIQNLGNQIVFLNKIKKFNLEHKEIIKNGYDLGVAIQKSLSFSQNQTKILWYGNFSNKDNPTDLEINGINFSLKEDSFILENMGLYKFLNLMTDSEYKIGQLHVFRDFATNEYEDWFKYTWNLLTSVSWKQTFKGRNREYKCEFIKDGEFKMFLLNNKVVTTLNTPVNNTSDYMKLVNRETRENVVARWINFNLKENVEYNRLKRICSEVAGENLVSKIKNNLNEKGLARFLQIRSKEYYYAKNDGVEIKILKVPSLDDFESTLEVSDIWWEVPQHQLNVYTKITNKMNKKSLVLRNECRFSHGQFNGTPEAKMYYRRGEDLTTVYLDVK